jgi:PIN domain nuclease of toxin-antitoxin system
MILIDTHPLIWFMQADQRLGPAARQVLQQNIDEGEAAVSPISFWEISMLIEKKRIALGQPTQTWVQGLLTGGLKVADLTPAIAVRAGALPGDIHGDPADRLIIATAQSLGTLIVTADRKILAYAVLGHVQAIEAHL